MTEFTELTVLHYAVWIASLVVSYVVGAVTAYRVALSAWQRHEHAHERCWPPLVRRLPPPPPANSRVMR